MTNAERGAALVGLNAWGLIATRVIVPSGTPSVAAWLQSHEFTVDGRSEIPQPVSRAGGKPEAQEAAVSDIVAYVRADASSRRMPTNSICSGDPGSLIVSTEFVSVSRLSRTSRRARRRRVSWLRMSANERIDGKVRHCQRVR